MNERLTMQKILEGRSVYVADIQDAEALFIKIKRSTVARGRIRGMIFPEMPENVRIIRARDIPGRNSLSVFGAEVPVLSAGTVSYKGEPVLLLAGPDERVLEELLEQIVIDYETQAPEFSFAEPAPENIFYTRKLTRGEPDKKFAQANETLSEDFSTGMQEHYYSEPHGSYVRWNTESSTLSVLSSSRWPFHVHSSLCQVLALPTALVSVSASEFSDKSLGGKIWYPSLVAAYAALAAWLTKKNVKAYFGREEDFLYTPKSSPSLLRYTAALDAEGNLLALKIAICINMGCASVFAKEISDRAAFSALGGYHCKDVEVTVCAAKTNLPPLGPFTGMGCAPSFFAMEGLAEKIRCKLDADPLVWKKAQLINKNRDSLTGPMPKAALPDPALFDLAARISDFTRKHSAFELARKRRSASNRLPDYFRGIGIALGGQVCGFFGSAEEAIAPSLKMDMDTEGKVRIFQSAIPGSFRLNELWRTVAAESLGAKKTEISIAPIFAESCRDAGPATFSRGMSIITRLVEECCDLLKKKRFRNPLPLSVSKTFAPSPQYPWDDAAFTGQPFIDMSWAVSVVELRIDPLTFIPEIDGIWMAVDGGKILKEEAARKSLESAINYAIGWSIFEQVQYKDGIIPPGQFAAYRIPLPCDIPTPAIEFFDAEGKRPSRGISDLAHTSIPAAYAAAMTQALSMPFSRIPVSLLDRQFSKEVPL
ncbi:MAG: xanthine dehydrogenase family protein molybdopterin-binding subunit [Spirochaetales bacterium]|jgi:CO/xanthine dehydrogenase Mo-binding subunit|nr:xanthine dehydrogenase family protein molybdopterin-binding subunit [Spirochaetales bacterium]